MKPIEKFPRLQLRIAGVTSAFELALRFTDWARQLGRDPTWQEIAERYGVHRATAYRWLRSWQAAQVRIKARP